MNEESRKLALKELRADLARCRTRAARELIEHEIGELERLRP
jgi:hypothetical protein